MNSNTAAAARQEAAQFQTVYSNIKSQIGRMMVGQDEVVDGVMTALLAGGHVLLEGVPGLGKTMLVRTLSQAVNAKFSRIQFTPDMMPADIQGTSILMETDRACPRSLPMPVRPTFFRPAAWACWWTPRCASAAATANGPAGRPMGCRRRRWPPTKMTVPSPVAAARTTRP